MSTSTHTNMKANSNGASAREPKKQINHHAALIAPNFKDLYAKDGEEAVKELKKLLNE